MVFLRGRTALHHVMLCQGRQRSHRSRARPPGPHVVDRRRQSPPVYGRRHYPFPPGHSALNRQHTEFHSPQSGP